MPAAILGNVAGAVVGGLMSDDGGGQQQTNTKEPWKPAAPLLERSLDRGGKLEDYYQQNPLNALQQQGYQNLYSDLDQFRSQMAPGLMDKANAMMNYSYQRGPRNSQMEMMQSQPMQAQQRPQMMQQGADGSYAPQGPQGGLLGAVGNAGGMPQMNPGAGQSMISQGLLSLPQGVFRAPSLGNYGQLDFQALNANNAIPLEPEKPAAVALPVDPANKPYDWRDDYERILNGQMNYTGAGA